MYSGLLKAKKLINDIYRLIATVAVSGIFVIMIVQVFFRYVLNNSLSWSEELARFMFVWASMLGAVVVTGNRGHAAIKMLDGFFPKVVNEIKELIFDLAAAAIGVILTVYGIKLVNGVWNQTSAAMKLCYAYVYMAIPVGGAGIALQSLINAISVIFELNGANDEKNEDKQDVDGRGDE